jgi:putative ABC transport system ATP-binding protein
MLKEQSVPLAKPNDPVWRQVTLLLQSLGMQLHVPIERSEIQRTLTNVSGGRLDATTNATSDGLVLWMMRAAQAARIRLAPIELNPTAAWNLVADGFHLVAVNVQSGMSPWWIMESTAGSGIDAVRIDAAIQPERLSRRAIANLFRPESGYTFLIAQPALFNEGSNASSSNANGGLGASDHHTGHGNDGSHGHGGGHGGGHDSHGGEHLSPQKRFLALLKPERSDIISVLIFSFVSVVLGLATPLTVEVLVNTIGFGSSFQPIFVLAMILMGVLFMSAAFKLLHIFVVEIMQRRFFVRLVGDLAYRLPHANRMQLQGVHGPELVNRFFDIMTIQKSTASLLLDGITIVMQTLIGSLLLAFYHPFLLGFDIVLLICMVVVTYVLGRGGVQTAIDESMVKYSIAHWLQDVVASPSAFKLHGGAEMSSDRSNRLAVQYLTTRRVHFIVLLRQMIFAMLLQIVALTTLFALGGYLVLVGQLTLGQLVASELIVAVIVGAFAKSGKLLETFFDLMAAMNKVGHMLDLSIDPPLVPMDTDVGPVQVRVQDLSIIDPASRQVVHVGSFEVPAGGRMAIAGIVGAADSMLLPTIVGLIQPEHGFVEIDGLDSRDALRFCDGSLVGYAGPREIFAGSVADNLRLGRSGISDTDLREALETVHLWDELLPLHGGLDLRLQTGGYPLCEDQLPRLMIARAIAGRPRVLLVDWCLDLLPAGVRYKIWDQLRASSQPWTLLLTTHDERVLAEAAQVFRFDECEGQHSH